MKVITATATIDATPERVWEVVSDFGGISQAAPHMTGSGLITEQETGVGAVRHCEFNMGNMESEETITRWEEGQGYSVDVKVSGPPMPVKSSTADFDISTRDGQTVLTGVMKMEMGWGPLGGVFEAMMGRRFGSTWAGMMAGFKERVETGREVDASSTLKVEAVTSS